MKTELLVVGMIMVAVLFGDSGKGNTVGNLMAASATKSKEKLLKYTVQMPMMTPEEVWQGFDPHKMTQIW